MPSTAAEGRPGRKRSGSRGHTFTGKPLSLMNVSCPTPPSPYKPSKHVQGGSHGASVTAAFVRGRQNMRVAARAVSTAAASISNLDHATKSPQVGCISPTRALDVAISQHRDASESTGGDEIFFELLFHEARRQFYVSAEETMRNDLIAGEEVAFSKMIIQELQGRAKLISGDENAVLVIKAAEDRAKKRQAMMERIEKEVSLRLKMQRGSELLAIQFEALLPVHKAGRECIIREESADLQEIFRWHKENRPLRGGKSLKIPKEDYRLTYAGQQAIRRSSSRSRSARWKRSNRSSVRTSRVYLAELELKRKSIRSPVTVLAPLVTTAAKDEAAPVTLLDGTLLLEHELAFQEEGKVRLQKEKNLRYADVRRMGQLQSLEKERADARQYILAEQAMYWMQITRLAMEGLYAAKEAKREREKREALEGVATAQRETQKHALKERVLLERELSAAKPVHGDSGESQAKQGIVNESTKEDVELPIDEAGAPASTVPDTLSPTSDSPVRSKGSEQQGVETTALNSDVTADDLAHLRHITDAITDQNKCKQLTALTSDEPNETDEGDSR
ncbi:hypothetical protein JKF63_02538 [Porcisia hertigi]|uniref:Uncharacterized protein n=1 Tax=Porcisia hertigi TaxID=2761500 RepID=A0A836L3W8_9TRYP|nr:hypothetical protein JKF63_02538 [Porcisia hertigi]